MASMSGSGEPVICESKRRFRRCLSDATAGPAHAVSCDAPSHAEQCPGPAVSAYPRASPVPGGGSQGVAGRGASGRWRGMSESGRGVSSSSSSKEPAQASRFVRKEERLKRVFTCPCREAA